MALQPLAVRLAKQKHVRLSHLWTELQSKPDTSVQQVFLHVFALN